MGNVNAGATTAAPPEMPHADDPPRPTPAHGRWAYELATCVVLLAALGWLVFGRHILRGGYYTDDWSIETQVLFHPHGPFGLLLSPSVNPGNRPLLLLYPSLVHILLGQHQHAYIAFSVLTAIALSIALYFVLREIGVGRPHALAISGLVLIWPYSDSTRLWFAATDSNVTITFCTLGVITALRGLAYQGRRAAIHHGGALLLFAASLLLYESTATVICVAGALYWWRAGRRAAIPRWAADIAVVLIVVFGFAQNTAIPRLRSISAIMSHAGVIYEQLLTVFTHTVFPFEASRTLILALAAALLLTALGVFSRLARENPLRADLGRWLVTALVGLAVAFVAATIYAPAVPYYSPLILGIGNRVNALPGVGLVISAYALYMILACLVVAGVTLARRRRGVAARSWAVALAIALAAVLGIRFAHLVSLDAEAYDLSSSEQLRALATLHAKVPSPPAGETIFSFGLPAYTAPGVPAFATPWGLDGAVQVTYHDPRINAYPVIPGSTVQCTDHGVAVALAGGPTEHAAYGRVALVDVARDRLSEPRDARQCKGVLPAFTPGPLTVLPGPSV